MYTFTFLHCFNENKKNVYTCKYFLIIVTLFTFLLSLSGSEILEVSECCRGNPVPGYCRSVLGEKANCLTWDYGGSTLAGQR